MKVEILVCRPDGTQTIELRDLPDNWFEPEESENEQ